MLGGALPTLQLTCSVMLVTVRGFCAIWERRFGKVPSRGFARPAFYNTTGVQVNGVVRYRWRTGGKIRFNGVGGFTPSNPSRSLNRVFECKDPETTGAGWKQILCKRMLSGPERSDLCLFVVKSEFTGRLDIGSSCWKADPVQVVSVSENADQQEAMLLMPAYSWVRGDLGTFYAEPSTTQFWSAGLRLERAGLAE
jgi:hypothetical protein